MKRFGIRLRLPESDPMRAPHLLGPDWEAYRWYPSQTSRDSAFERLQREDVYYRRGDVQSLVMEKVER